MATLVIPTAEHTGSRLLAQHIFHSFKLLKLHEPPKDNSKYYYHVDVVNTPRFVQLATMGRTVNGELKRHPCIVPLRHPIRCANSFETRNKPIDRFFLQWDLIINQIDKLNPLYIRIDHEDRSKDLRKINDKLDLNLDTIWPYIGERGWPWVSLGTPGVIPLEECRLKHEKIVLKYIEDNKQFFGRFYAC